MAVRWRTARERGSNGLNDVQRMASRALNYDSIPVSTVQTLKRTVKRRVVEEAALPVSGLVVALLALVVRPEVAVVGFVIGLASLS